VTLKTRWQDGINLVCGIWLFMSPYTLDFRTEAAAAWTVYTTGAAVIAVSVLALKNPRRWQEWTIVAIAGALFLSPFVLGFSDVASATANNIFLSLIIGMDALWVMTQGSQHETA
jgi:hypothetical protein